MATRSIMAVAAVLGFALSAQAGVKTFSPSGGNTGTWNTPGDWSPSGVPTGADRVVIPSTKVCTLDVNATADTLEIEDDGLLIIDATYSLTLENNSDNIAGTPDNSVIDGELRLGGNIINSALLSITTASHTFTGGGKITGTYTASDQIEIGVNLSLVNQLATAGQGIRGSMTITGLTASGQTNGTLVNEGLVQAGDANAARLVLASTTILDDISGAIWSVDACKGQLVFDRAATSLEGDLYVGTACGSFEINANIYTCGTYTRNAGGLQFSNSATLIYAGFAAGSLPCDGNPGAIINNAQCGTDEYVVSTNQRCCSCCN